MQANLIVTTYSFVSSSWISLGSCFEYFKGENRLVIVFLNLFELFKYLNLGVFADLFSRVQNRVSVKHIKSWIDFSVQYFRQILSKYKDKLVNIIKLGLNLGQNLLSRVFRDGKLSRSAVAFLENTFYFNRVLVEASREVDFNREEVRMDRCFSARDAAIIRSLTNLEADLSLTRR